MKRSRILSEEALGPDPQGHDQFLVTSVSYDLGGMCFGTYRNKPRGYYVSVAPESRFTTESGHPMKSFGLFSGLTSLIQPARSFSQKVLDAIQPDPEKVAQLRQEVLGRMKPQSAR